jgi:hypothetical protein
MFLSPEEISTTDLSEFKPSLVRFVKEYRESSFIENSLDVLYRAMTLSKKFVNFKDREAVIDSALERLNFLKPPTKDNSNVNLSESLQKLYVDFILQFLKDQIYYIR